MRWENERERQTPQAETMKQSSMHSTCRQTLRRLIFSRGERAVDMTWSMPEALWSKRGGDLSVNICPLFISFFFRQDLQNDRSDWTILNGIYQYEEFRCLGSFQRFESFTKCFQRYTKRNRRLLCRSKEKSILFVEDQISSSSIEIQTIHFKQQFNLTFTSASWYYAESLGCCASCIGHGWEKVSLPLLFKRFLSSRTVRLAVSATETFTLSLVLISSSSPSLIRRPVKPKQIGRAPILGRPRLFGGKLLDYIQVTQQHVPLIISSCVSAINRLGLHNQVNPSSTEQGNCDQHILFREFFVSLVLK